MAETASPSVLPSNFWFESTSTTTSSAFDLGALTWVLLFVFPRTTPLADTAFLRRPKLYNSTAESVLYPARYAEHTLALHGIAFAQVGSDELFVWGNALLYSARGGQSFYLLKTFPTTRIKHLAYSESGRYTFLTDSGELWVGDVGSMELVQVRAASADDAGTAVIPHFTSFSDLAPLAVTVAASNVSITTLSQPWLRIIEYQSYMQDVCSVGCKLLLT